MLVQCRFGFSLVVIAVSLICLGARAAPVTPAAAKKLAKEFYVRQALLSSGSRHAAGIAQAPASHSISHSSLELNFNGCVSQPSCLNVACEKLGSTGCDQTDEIQDVAAACQGNSDGNCLKTACDKLGSTGCDQLDEVQAVASACRGNYGSCLQVSCNLLGSTGCDQLDEIQAVTGACRGADGECVRSACAHLGSTGCDSFSEIQVIAQACGGQ